MTLEIGFFFVVLASMVILFLTELIPVDVTAFAGLTVLALTGLLPADEVFSGFASPAVITMLAIFIVGAALLRTGIADTIGGRLHAVVGSREVPLIITLMLVAGVLSSFINNIAATAVLMPAVATLANRADLSPSHLFMPLSVGAILGGTTTLVGTYPNILAASILQDRHIETFDLFDFTPMGAVLLVGGTLFMATVGRRFLPERIPPRAGTEIRELAGIYQLREQLFSLRIPERSPLAGLTLLEAQVGKALGAQVAAIQRGDKQLLAPGPETVLAGGDVLLVQGDLENLRRLFRVRGANVERIGAQELPGSLQAFSAARLRVSEISPVAGLTLRTTRFRERYGVVVVGILRGDEVLSEQLADEELAIGDELLCLGGTERIESLAAGDEFETIERGLECLRPVQPDVFVIFLPESSPLVGRSVRQTRLGELAGLTVGGIIRDWTTNLDISPGEKLQAGDRLVVAGRPLRILRLLEFAEVPLETHADAAGIESEETGVVEAAITPRSRIVGETLAELEFRSRFGLQVLGIWREGELLRGHLARVPLRTGDALLLQGSWRKIRDLSRGEHDLVVLSEHVQAPRRRRKAPHAFGALVVMIAMVVTRYQPIHIAAFTAATLILLSGALTMQEAYRAIEWRAIFLVATILPVGVAMETSGAASLIARSVIHVAEMGGPYALLGMFVVLAGLLSQGFGGAPTMVLLAPVALQAAEKLSISPYPIMMGVSLAASAAFITPFSHKSSLLVMGAGGYKVMDYVAVGSILTVLLLVALVLMVPLFFAF